MTISEVIREYNGLRRRPLPPQTVIRIVNGMEDRIKKEIVDHCRDSEDYPFEGYTEADLETELIAPRPYDMVYVWAVCYKHDLRENQVQNASNSYSMMEDIFGKLASYWIRNHEPKKRQLRDEWRNV